eukprot:GHUV01028223.1.p1 GENE.GHUV01028223.1~~GHUV01028223.1.p1  ORF type:complete len:218 (-),score=64.44 GHUV01028223.1:574-1227(-)
MSGSVFDHTRSVAASRVCVPNLQLMVCTTRRATIANTPCPQVFDYPSIRDMSEYLATNYTQATIAPAAAVQPSAQARPDDAAVTAAATALVAAAVQELLGAGRHIDPSAPLMTAGLNSTTAVALAASLETATGNTLPPTLVSGVVGSWCLVCVLMLLHSDFSTSWIQTLPSLQITPSSTCLLCIGSRRAQRKSSLWYSLACSICLYRDRQISAEACC